MKKIILFTLSIFSVLTLNASNYKNNLKYDFSVYGGINFIKPAPVFGAKLGIQYFCLRANIDVGKTIIKHPLCLEGFTTFSSSVGLAYGEKQKVYIMVGFQNHGYINNNKDPLYFRSDHIYGLVKIGFQHLIFHRLFLNYEINHLFHDNKSGAVHFPNTNLCIGLGFSF